MQKNESSSRGRLRAAAKMLFAERGYEGTAISDITRSARTSHSQFLKYYSEKDQLRREIIDEQWTELTNAIILASVGVASPVEKLRLALNMVISLLEREPECRAIMLLEQTVVRKQGAPAASKAFGELVRVLDDMISAIRSAGQLKENIDPHALRSALLGASEGMMRDQLLASANFPAHYSSQRVRFMLSLMIDSACDFQRPETGALAALAAEAVAGSEDEWIHYYLKLADRALHPSELS